MPRVQSRCIWRANFPWFSCTRFSPFILHFSLLFPFLHFLSFFSWYSRVFLFFKLSFSVLRSLVSSSQSSFFSYSSMVDYSFVRVDCPLVSFLFARLVRFLRLWRESVSRGLVFLWGRTVLIGLSFPLYFLWFLVLLELLVLWKCLGKLGLVS